jgi:hypothetical protein
VLRGRLHTGRGTPGVKPSEIGRSVWARILPPDLVRINADNTRWLKGFARYGWPGVTLVGEQQANEAWLLAQCTARYPDSSASSSGFCMKPSAPGPPPHHLA